MTAAKDPGLRVQVEAALDTLRPYLEADGGSVRLVEITEEMVVELELLGACETCPMSSMTLRAGIEQAVKRSVPQINRVEAVNV
ncbi:MAG: NifU family protein [Rhodothermales bacterium]|nr:NifU family protein [Rhodothermales bacterium]MDG2017378.1 NifU family protein [Rhodothermales bacterium]